MSEEVYPYAYYEPEYENPEVCTGVKRKNISEMRPSNQDFIPMTRDGRPYGTYCLILLVSLVISVITAIVVVVVAFNHFECGCQGQEGSKEVDLPRGRVAGDHINLSMIRTKTSGSLQDYKMDGTGFLKINICTNDTNSVLQCCQTGVLDNPDLNDFETGQVDEFRQLGECQRFVLYDNAIQVQALHSGSDAWGGDYVELVTTQGQIWRCFSVKGAHIVLYDKSNERLSCRKYIK